MLVKRQDLYACARDVNARVEEVLQKTPEVNSFIRRFLAYLHRDPTFMADFVHNHQAQFLDALSESRFSPRCGPIPLIAHKVWLTNPEASVMPPPQYLENYFGMLAKQTTGWTNYFWTNCETVADRLRTMARERGLALLVCSIDDALSQETAYPRITALIAARKFVLACDILKFVLLTRFGGLYSDLGIVYTDDAARLLEGADYALLLGNHLFFQTSFVACAPNAPLASLFLGVLNAPGALARDYIMVGSTFTALDEVQLSAGPGFTALALLFMPSDARVMLFPPRCACLTWDSQASWYGAAPKHGNALIQESQPTLATVADFGPRDVNADSDMRFYGPDPLLHERLAILVGLVRYFAAHPTPLCEILRFNNSDKGLGWHNYSQFYYYLLDEYRLRTRVMLEIGIGTNYLDIPSSMGADGTPGASLRAWREYFIKADIHGADIDRRILIDEERIKSHFVDQTDPETVRELAREVAAGRNLDVVIDDGLHAFEPNRQVLELLYPHLPDGALYVVEDIRQFEFEAWHAYLATSSYSAVLLRLGHPNNKQDNCILFITKQQMS